ncbi:MAG TPA: NAD(P)-binding protein, partial [Candidatus Tectomicrobia bacterium]
LYERLAPWLDIFERKVSHREQAGDATQVTSTVKVILFGLGRYGNNIACGLRRSGCDVLGVDFDPEAIRAWLKQGLPAHYGDAEDPEFPASLSQAPWIVSAIPLGDINLALLHALRHHGYTGQVALTAHTTHDAERLRSAGADVVFLPFSDAAERAVELLTTPAVQEISTVGYCISQGEFRDG